MSRKVLFTLATAATIAAAATLASSAADARGGGGGGGFGGGGHMASFSRGGGGGFGGARFTGTRFTGNHFNQFGGRHFADFRRGPRPFPPIWWHHHHHWHWWFHDGRWAYVEEPVVDPVVGSVATPGPCTCLTKTYTQDGLVVFADVCTKEAASARVDGADVAPKSEVTPPPPAAQADSPAVADASQGPTTNNYAGKTYQDFLAANAGATQKN